MIRESTVNGPLRVGKLPPELLTELLVQVDVTDPRVLVGPRMGEDAALIDTGGEHYLVVSSDPVTFAAEELGWYTVHVNANDIAAMGATPSWMLVTVLLPSGAPTSLAQDIMRDILDACGEIGVALVGGHTEVTSGLDRPVAIGTMIGEVRKGAATLSSGVREGDAIILTKGIGIEGTAILARERADHLRAAGLGDDVIQRAASLLHDPGISVVRDAALATGAAHVHAMHDPTEGGIATALHEMADASDVGLEIYAATLQEMTLRETSEICRAIGASADDVDPLGLIAAGALIIATARNDTQKVTAALEDGGIRAMVIGYATARPDGVRRIHDKDNGTSQPLPRFARDELARILAG